jgi:hypothetical protein
MNLQKIQSELQRLQRKLDEKFTVTTNKEIEALLKQRDVLESKDGTR